MRVQRVADQLHPLGRRQHPAEAEAPPDRLPAARTWSEGEPTTTSTPAAASPAVIRDADDQCVLHSASGPSRHPALHRGKHQEEGSGHAVRAGAALQQRGEESHQLEVDTFIPA